MLNLGPEKILVVLVVALIVLGPDKLPQAARTIGNAYKEFRRLTGGLEAEVRETLAGPLQEVRSIFEEPSPAAPSAPGTNLDDPIWHQEPPEPELPTAPRPTSRPVPSPGDPSLN